MRCAPQASRSGSTRASSRGRCLGCLDPPPDQELRAVHSYYLAQHRCARRRVFRLEWKLAVDRSHLIAANRPFLVPVVIDDTSGQGERVPDRFHDVHWTRLAGGRNPAEFVERVAGCSHRIPRRPPRRKPGPGAAHGVARHSIGPIDATGLPFVRALGPGGLVILALGYFLADKFLASKPAAPTIEAPAKAAMPAASDRSIAVLPFVDMSEKRTRILLGRAVRGAHQPPGAHP